MFQPLIDQISDTDATGTVFTADQLHTQREHAEYLHGRDAFYVFTVGGNQPRLFAAIDALPWTQIAVEHATIDRGHGRIEVRTIRTLPVTATIAGLFPHAAQVFLLERYIYDTAGKPLGAVAVLGITTSPPAKPTEPLCSPTSAAIGPLNLFTGFVTLSARTTAACRPRHAPWQPCETWSSGSADSPGPPGSAAGYATTAATPTSVPSSC